MEDAKNLRDILKCSAITSVGTDGAENQVTSVNLAQKVNCRCLQSFE